MKNLSSQIVNARSRRESLRALGSYVLGFFALFFMAVRPAAAKQAFGQASDIFNVGAGARSMGMGSAFTGLADDASAPYFNPAGLAYLDEHQLMLMHAPLFIDSQYDFLSSAHPFGDKWGTLSVSDALLTSNKFQVRDASNVLLDSNGSVSQNAIFGSYAHKVHQNVAAGFNLKMIQQKIVGMSDNALGLDLGVMFRHSRLFSAGFSFANANEPSVRLQSEKDVFRSVARLGLASEVFPDKLTLTADLIKPAGEDKMFAAGAEFTPTRLMTLRTGFNANRSYTLGLGLNLKPFRIDYAFSDTDLGVFNKVSITWAWHNIYKTDIQPPTKEGHAVFPLKGFENQVVFKTDVPNQFVAKWSLQIKDSEGKPVRTLESDLRPPEQIVWDAKNSVGEPVVAGLYNYQFTVDYKNGKRWINIGNIDLALPNHKINEVIDMSLQLNGAKDGESNVTAQAPKTNAPPAAALQGPAPVTPVAPPPANQPPVDVAPQAPAAGDATKAAPATNNQQAPAATEAPKSAPASAAQEAPASSAPETPAAASDASKDAPAPAANNAGSSPQEGTNK